MAKWRYSEQSSTAHRMSRYQLMSQRVNISQNWNCSDQGMCNIHEAARPRQGSARVACCQNVHHHDKTIRFDIKRNWIMGFISSELKIFQNRFYPNWTHHFFCFAIYQLYALYSSTYRIHAWMYSLFFSFPVWKTAQRGRWFSVVYLHNTTASCPHFRPRRQAQIQVCKCGPTPLFL